MARVQIFIIGTIGALLAFPSGAFTVPVSSPDSLGTLLSPDAPHADDEEPTRLAQKKKRKKRSKSSKRKKKEKATADQAESTTEARKALAEEAPAPTKSPAQKEDAAAVSDAQPETTPSQTPPTESPAAESTEPATANQAQASNRVEAKGLDARIRRLTDALARSLKRLPGDIREQSFAVMPFQETGEETESNQLGLVVADLVVTNLARDHRLQLTERSQLNRIVEEQELGALGFVEPEQAARIGVLAGATALVLGEILDLGESFQVGARVVDASSGQVLAVEAMELPKAELIAFSADAVVLRSRSGAFFRSLVVPGWGQVYNREPGKAAIVGATVGALILGSAGTALSAWLTQRAYGTFGDEERANAVKEGLNPSDVVGDLRNSANLQYSIAASLAGGVVLVWLGNAVDAYLSGVDVENLDAALAKR